MNHLILSILLLALIFICGNEATDLQWDELKFTQEWGFSACRQFKDRGVSNKCRFEGKPSIWSVHGIWPTKKGSEGPNFCSKVTFDIDMLTPIMDDLKHFWYEIDDTKQANHFWEHEWVKHGSCAKELDTFGTELKYFSQGLDLRSKMDIYSILKSGGSIIPQTSNSKGYLLEDIHNAFRKSLGSQSAVPYVQCLKTKNSVSNEVEYHLLAIEICLDQTLNVVDCSNKKHTSLLGDNAEPCPPNAPILYEDNFPPFSKKKNPWNYKQTFLKNLPMSKKYWKKIQNKTVKRL